MPNDNPKPVAIPIGRDVEAYSGLKRTRQYELLSAGKLRAKKAGKQTLVITKSIDECVEALPSWQPKSVTAA